MGKDFAGVMQRMLAALLVGMPGPCDALVDWIVTPSYALCITPKIGSSMFLEYARWVALDDATVGNCPSSGTPPRACPPAGACTLWRFKKLARSPPRPDATVAYRHPCIPCIDAGIWRALGSMRWAPEHVGL